MYNYLSFPLAIGIIFSNVASGIASEVLNRRNFLSDMGDRTSLIVAQTKTEISTTKAKAEPTYLALMNAGYAADRQQNYLEALKYFQQALSLQPEDSTAKKAIQNISRYGFDLYMRSGYTADRVKDYASALQNFQKALQIRPDSLYAQQAIDNINFYMAQQPTPSDEEKGSGINWWLILIGIGITSAFSAGLLFYLFKKTGSLSEESQLEESEHDESQPIGSEDATILRNNSLEENAETTDLPSASASASADSSVSETPLSGNPIATTKEPSREAAIVPSTNSLAKLDLIPELIDDLNTSDRGKRRKAVWELAQRGDSRAMKPLVELMIEVDSQERSLILEAMTQIAARTLKPMNKAIAMSLQDDSTQVRQNAIRDLTRVYELMSQVTKRLSEAVEDSDAQVQETAKWALQKLDRVSNTTAWQTEKKKDRDLRNLNSSNGQNGVGGIDLDNEPRYPMN